MSYVEDQDRDKKRRNRILFPCIYVLAVVVCMSFYLYADDIWKLVGLLGLFVVLLPWSLVTGILIFGSFYHGGDAQIPEITIITSIFNVITFFVINSFTPKKDKTTQL